MKKAPIGSALQSSFISSPLKSSRGWLPLRMSVVFVNAGNVAELSYSWLTTTVGLEFPEAKPGHILVRYWDWPHSTYDELTIWMLRKYASGKFYYAQTSTPDYNPTPKAVDDPYNPRASKNDPGSGLGLQAAGWKVKISGECWGTLCQYTGQVWLTADTELLGEPEDSEVIDIEPDSYIEIDQTQNESFTFAPEGDALAPTDGNMGYPAIAIFWPGMHPSDFSWYVPPANPPIDSDSTQIDTDNRPIDA